MEAIVRTEYEITFPGYPEESVKECVDALLAKGYAVEVKKE